MSQADRYMLAVLWTRASEAALSNQTALDAYDISDVNPNIYHVTVGKQRRLRREDGRRYEVTTRTYLPNRSAGGRRSRR